MFKRAKYISLSELSAESVPFFARLVREDISQYYPGTESHYGYTLALDRSTVLNSGKIERRRIIWSVLVDDQPVGFCVVTRKADASAKLGPVVVDRRFRLRGHASKLVNVICKRYSDSGVRKLYMTVPSVNHPIVKFAVHSGFTQEAVLVKHYCRDYNELVFSRYVTPIDVSTVTSVCRKPECNVAVDPLSSGRMIIRTQPKRGGAVKVSGLIADQPLEQRVATIERFHLRNGMRKLFTLVPSAERALIDALANLGFAQEAALLSGGQIYQHKLLLAKHWRN